MTTRTRSTQAPGHRRFAAVAAVCALVVGVGGFISGTAQAESAGPSWRTAATDEFERTAGVGWGSADQGGAYTPLTAPSTMSVSDGAGWVRDLPSGTSGTVGLSTVVGSDMRVGYDAVFPQVGAGSWTAYQGVQLRRQKDGSSYRPRVRVTGDGRVALGASRTAPGTEVPLGSIDLPVRATATASLSTRFQVTGSASVEVRGKAWLAGTAEPDWQFVVTDSSPDRIAGPGASTVWTYAGSGSPVTVAIDHLTVSTSDPLSNAPSPADTSTADGAQSAGSSLASAVSSPANGPSLIPATSSELAATSAAVPSTPVSATTSGASAPATSTEPAAPVSSTSAPVTSSSATTTSPSPSAGFGGQASKPGASSTGVRSGTVLSRYTGPLTITTPGTVIENKAVYGDLRIQARDVVIRNSYLHCGSGHPSSNTGCVDANSSNVYNLLIENNTIIPDSPSYFRDGIVGHEFTARGNHISRTNDGIGIFNRPGGAWQANVRVTGNYIHDLTHWNYDPAHSDGTHNDGIEIQGGQNIYIAGNNIVGSVVAGDGLGVFGLHGGAALLVTQNVSKVDNLVIEKNWFDDAQNSICIQHGKWSDVTVTLQNNWFGRNQYKFSRNSSYQIRIYSESQDRVIGLLTNRWEDTNGLLTVGRDTGIRYNGA